MSEYLQVKYGEVVELDGVPHRYIGGGVWQPVESPMLKRFDAAGEEMTPAAVAALARYGIEAKCD